MTESPAILLFWERVVGEVLDRTLKFPKSVRFTFSVRIDSLALDVYEQLAGARFAVGAEKLRLLTLADTTLFRLRLLLRLAHTRRLLDTGGYEHVMRELDEAGRMLGGWMNHLGAR